MIYILLFPVRGITNTPRWLHERTLLPHRRHRKRGLTSLGQKGHKVPMATTHSILLENSMDTEEPMASSPVTWGRRES